jgi:hypothetical protein
MISYCIKVRIIWFFYISNLVSDKHSPAFGPNTMAGIPTNTDSIEAILLKVTKQ